jgi:AcrR family transcriptional regulator
VTSALPPERRSRPANRRELILAAATELFADRGYEFVSMSEIADAVDVQPSALYRHFSGKEQLLEAILRLGLAGLQAAVSALELAAQPDGLPEVAGFIIDNRHIVALVGRELPHLSEASRPEVRAELVKVAQILADKIASARPQLAPVTADFLAWAALAVLQSPAFHRTRLPRADYCAEIAQLARKAIAAQPPAELTGATHRRNATGLLPHSRREALLARAITLFAAGTYSSVGIEDVAATLGIAGPSVYNHFPSKSWLLVTALDRASAYLSMQLTDTLDASDRPEAALRTLITSYAAFAAKHPALIDLMISEVRSLPDPYREATLTSQRDYVAELAHLLRQVFPDLSPSQAHIQVQAALMIANDVARVPHLRDQADSPQAVAALCDQMLALPASAAVR